MPRPICKVPTHRDASRAAVALFLGSLLITLLGCGSPTPAPEEALPTNKFGAPELLSEYGLFQGPPQDQTPAAGVIPYDLNTPLFSDYTAKYRFIQLPDGQSATYVASDSGAADVHFPVGTIIAKTFAMPVDLRDPSAGERIIETRILWNKPDDGWVGLPYIWNDEQTDAQLKLAGAFVDLEWTHSDGEHRTNNYIIPNANQCKGCHKAHEKQMSPIGPKLANLNGDFAYAHGTENQLAHWVAQGALEPVGDPAELPRFAVWDDPSTGSLDDRARAWLDANCAHCHNPEGPARNSGLDLLATQTEPYKIGHFKAPVASGRGNGGRFYDIVPSKPDESVLYYRITSTDPAAMMPELGKRLVHTEGAELIRQWIAAMPPADDEKAVAPNEVSVLP